MCASQIARRSNRAARRNARIDVVVDQRAKPLDQFDAHTGETFGERYDLDQHDQPDDLVVEVLPHADGVRAHEIFLQMRKLLVADTHLRQLSEAGIDAVDLFAAGNNIVDEFIRFRDAPLCIPAQGDSDWRLPDTTENVERDQLVFDDQIHFDRSRLTIGRLRPCSRAQSIAIS